MFLQTIIQHHQKAINMSPCPFRHYKIFPRWGEKDLMSAFQIEQAHRLDYILTTAQYYAI
jgi:hypothetical protein